MEILQGVLNGFQVALQPINLLYCFVGVFIGTLVGVLPGLGPAAAIALLLPSTFALSPVPSVIMLAGIYYGAMYGGSTTSILVNIPGEAASVVTCLDGHAMARQGRAGPGAAAGEGYVELRAAGVLFSDGAWHDSGYLLFSRVDAEGTDNGSGRRSPR
jgi:TctA family transporter